MITDILYNSENMDTSRDQENLRKETKLEMTLKDPQYPLPKHQQNCWHQWIKAFFSNEEAIPAPESLKKLGNN